MKIGAQCMLKLDNAVAKKAKGSPQAKFISRMMGQFGWIFERKVTIKCGVDDMNASKDPYKGFVRSDRERRDPPDQTFTVLNNLRVPGGTGKFSGVAALCKEDASEMGMKK